MGDSPISWKSKKQATISLSFSDAEYREIRQVVGELVWLERLLSELDVKWPCLYMFFVTVKQQFTLPRIQFFMNGQNILKLIAICKK